LVGWLAICPMIGFASPEPFFWGVGHSAFQVEGSPEKSDWSVATETPGKIADGSNADIATDFWKNPKTDLDLAEKLGAKMFRLSIAWERIELAPGQWDQSALDRYQEIIVEIRKRGMEPLVTLHHFVLPLWLADQGGLLASDFSSQFSKYSQKVVGQLSKEPAKVKWWMTFNEPGVLVAGGYILGEWPPFVQDNQKSRSALMAMAHAHNLVVESVRANSDLSKDLKFSVAYHWRDIQADGFGPFNSLVAKMGDYFFNRYFLNSIAKNLDYLGLNYYGRSVIHPSSHWPFFEIDEGTGPLSDLNWVVYPEGLGHALKDAYAAYKLPILISENGVADSKDSMRIDFIKNHILQVRKAQASGVDVIGYLHWSLTDNFEWAKGLAPRFGLVEMNYETGERKPRPSYYFYQKVINSDKKKPAENSQPAFGGS
jgi:beta-glucosidase